MSAQAKVFSLMHGIALAVNLYNELTVSKLAEGPGAKWSYWKKFLVQTAFWMSMGYLGYRGVDGMVAAGYGKTAWVASLTPLLRLASADFVHHGADMVMRSSCGTDSAKLVKTALDKKKIK